MSERTYLAWRDGERKAPDSWFRGCSAPIMTEDEYLAAERSGPVPSGGRNWERPAVQITWTDTLHDLVPRIPGELVPALRKLGGPDDVRVVFGFDN